MTFIDVRKHIVHQWIDKKPARAELHRTSGPPLVSTLQPGRSSSSSREFRCLYGLTTFNSSGNSPRLLVPDHPNLSKFDPNDCNLQLASDCTKFNRFVNRHPGICLVIDHQCLRTELVQKETRIY